MTVLEWARKWALPPEALGELAMLTTLATDYNPPLLDGASEEAVQARCRLKAPQLGGWLMRNNVGALLDARGVPVRFGLANDTAAVNEVCKSSDLIGLYPLLITPQMVGQVVGQFWAVECKHGSWQFGEDKKRETAQLNFGNRVRQLGGRFNFANHEDFM